MDSDLKVLYHYMLDFNNLFQRVSEISREQPANYPPYNLSEDESKTKLTLEMALAGFKSSEVSVYTENGFLHIQGTKDEASSRNYVHRGLANRSFKWCRAFPDNMKVDNVDFDGGLLTVTLQKVIPEDKKRKVWF